jgi:hypothetical protein
VRKLKATSIVFRAIAKMLLALTALAGLGSLISVTLGIGGIDFGGTAVFQTAGLKLTHRLLLGLITLVTWGIAFKGFFHLHRLFGNYSRGEVFTRKSVAQLRKFGVACVFWGVMSFVWRTSLEISLHPANAPRGSSDPAFILVGVVVIGIAWLMDMAVTEQQKREHLENELSVARQVQKELFPRSLPVAASLELGAVCRAARVVSGDYYDYLQIDPQRVALAVADISGKGISAALLMASLNAALRSLVLTVGASGVNTAALAERLNRHLLLNTSDDRYATLFFAVYDAAAHTLAYTNAGHVAPLLIAGDRVQKLDRGGPVIGLLENCNYEQVSIAIDPGSLLLVYSDGVTEAANAQGEEFGAVRLEAEILQHREARPGQLCDVLIDSVEKWCAPVEPVDDQTIVAARMG